MRRKKGRSIDNSFRIWMVEEGVSVFVLRINF